MRFTPIFVLAWWLALSPFAWADPQIEIEGEWVYASIEISAPTARILELIRDPYAVAEVGGRGVVVVESIPTANGCTELELLVPSALTRVRYREESCLTPAGRRSRLVQSRELKRYESTWEVIEQGEGRPALVRYNVRTAPTFPAPKALVARITARSVRYMLTAIKARLEAGTNPA